MKPSSIHQTIVETASTLFYNQGYNSTGVNEIIEKAGIAKATLYSHFKSKEDICVSYIRYKNSEFLEEIRIYSHSKKKGANQILSLFDFLDSFFDQKDFNGCWCINTVSEIPKDNVKIRKEIISQKETFINFINELISENIVLKTKSEGRTLAKHVYLLYESAVSESHLHQDKWPIKEAKKLASQIIN